ncbi:2-oxoglutarate dehydrogenase complex E2 component [Aspergillus puulaauensis]|uniref:dihydrolipoyllysine-residue succinyltransferase n=1 Tax=Aspergillus puulaauensis TaxID=1220207 RepID=A0A7R8ALQ4_9EURO|nr:2-oxoglutarate dehydrogenase complex E2 component [Aspergillus puulaauensis]BCS24204.1 2-oxoglutarate dehydrogenase complex E2 component [Aspergillus puulaauensis]
MAESITEGTVGRLNKTVGEFIGADEELAAIETDKIDVSVNVPRGGVVTALLVGEGDTVRVDQEIAEVIPGDEQRGDWEEDVKGGNVPSEAGKESRKDTVKDLDTPTTVESGKTQSTPEQTDVSRVEEVVKMPRIRLATAKRLKESQNTTAYLTTFNKVDMSKLLQFRKKSKEAVLEKHGVKLGFMGPMARASALALKQIPAVNASIEGEDTIVYRDYVDLSVAAAIPKGLVTPVLRNVETMGVLDIERGIAELVKKAREGKLTMSDLTGGTFTISNSGIWGSLFGTPIINLPQTAVLGTYGIQDRPVAVDGRVEIRPMMYIALTYDHRIIDGREAVVFLNLIKNYLEDPESMLLA